MFTKYILIAVVAITILIGSWSVYQTNKINALKEKLNELQNEVAVLEFESEKRTEIENDIENNRNLDDESIDQWLRERAAGDRNIP